MYKVTEKDLIGELKGFPIEVVQKMIERQVEQQGLSKISVFQKNRCSNAEDEGFDWTNSIEGSAFWNIVICGRDFNTFFEKYPKENNEEMAHIVEEKESRKNDFKDHKLRWDLLPLLDVEEIVKVYTAGAEKYGDNNWQNLDNGFQRYKAAMLRHLVEHEKGNLYDEETKCLHIAQTAWNAIAMLHMVKKELENKNK